MDEKQETLFDMADFVLELPEKAVPPLETYVVAGWWRAGWWGIHTVGSEQFAEAVNIAKDLQGKGWTHLKIFKLTTKKGG